MQVIKTDEHRKYFCPLKYTPSTTYTERCDGPKCMWWKYASIEIFRQDKSFTPSPPTFELDKDRGYCGK